MFFLAGGDHEEELARLKGEYDALESAAIQSDCDIADDLEEARRVREEEAAAKIEAATVDGPTYLGAGKSTRP